MARTGAGVRFGDVRVPQGPRRRVKRIDQDLIDTEVCHDRKTIVR